MTRYGVIMPQWAEHTLFSTPSLSRNYSILIFLLIKMLKFSIRRLWIYTLNENICISNKISLKHVPDGSIDCYSTLFQLTVWRRTGGKPLLEPILTKTSAAIWRHWTTKIDENEDQRLYVGLRKGFSLSAAAKPKLRHAHSELSIDIRQPMVNEQGRSSK